jgi:hypothetical protein
MVLRQLSWFLSHTSGLSTFISLEERNMTQAWTHLHRPLSSGKVPFSGHNCKLAQSGIFLLTEVASIIYNNIKRIYILGVNLI